jgi:hypothetical protein
MLESTYRPFSRTEALDLWSWLVAGWANNLDKTGARTLYEGVPNYADAGGSFEGVTRMLWGLGSWLSYPDRAATLEWHGQAYDVEQLTYRAFVNGCDPTSSGYWGRGRYSQDADQRTVETGQVAFSLWQTRARIWARMSDHEQKNVIDFLDRFGRRPDTWVSNWALFWVLNHAGRKALNVPYNQTIIDDVMTTYMEGVYCGDGWYDDVARRGAGHFDDYITWVFAMHVMAWAQMDRASMPQRRDELLGRVRAWMVHYPYFFSADGGFNEFGRSLAYKFSRLGAPIWAYKLGLWPYSAGMLKRLVGKHLRWYVDRGALRPDGTLRQSLTATGSPEIIERYISTGATYWAMQAFSGLWALADDDAFWTAEEEPLPAEAADFTKVYPEPGWIVTARGGHVQRFNAGSVKPGYGGKYSKLVYSTRHPFNVGLDGGQASLDSCLCLNENGIRGQRGRNLACAVSKDGWLRVQYVVPISDHEHIVDTTIILLGDVHLRAHRITIDPSALDVIAEEGSAPLCYDAGAIPSIYSQDGWVFAASTVYAASAVYSNDIIGIRAIKGYSGVGKILPGSPNSVYRFNVLGVLNALVLQPVHDLICLVYAGGIPDMTQLPVVENPGWAAEGQFTVTINNTLLTIPPLASALQRA